MPFRITITQSEDANAPVSDQIERYSQTVDHLDLQAVIAAINTPAKPPKKRRSDAGKPRAQKGGQA